MRPALRCALIAAVLATAGCGQSGDLYLPEDPPPPPPPAAGEPGTVPEPAADTDRKDEAR